MTVTTNSLLDSNEIKLGDIAGSGDDSKASYIYDINIGDDVYSGYRAELDVADECRHTLTFVGRGY